ncbi:MAG: hypothetical protein KAR62_01780 [Sphingomonadales bacterium]|nr:hypothetical protein [Sphingomonadales bacterium]
MKNILPAKTNMALIAIAAFTLSSCSYFDTEHTIEVETSHDQIITTGDLVDSVPDGLIGDTENSRQTSERLRNNDES